MHIEHPSPAAASQYVKVPNCIGLYRHTLSNRYYGVKKLHGKRREVSLKTTDRKIAERRLKDWIANLEKVDVEVERTSLRELLRKFLAVNAGKSRSTQRCNLCICRSFERTWRYHLDMEVREIRPSQLDEWLAMHERRLKNSSYNRYAGFLKQLFEIAVNDRILPHSPFEKVRTRWKKPQKPKRHIPTMEHFRAIVEAIRNQPFTDHAEDSADFVEFLGLAALGQAEASALTWGDINWARNVIRVHRRKTDTPFTIPIYPHLRPLLERLRLKARRRISPNARVLMINDAKKSLRTACQSLRLPNYTQRNLRQFGIGLLWKAGIDKKYIAKWQGHCDGGELIISTYTEVFSDDESFYEQEQLAKLKVHPLGQS
jgi:integrase